MDLQVVQGDEQEQNTLYEIARAINKLSEEGALGLEEKTQLVKRLKTTLTMCSKDELQCRYVESEVFKNYDFIRVKSIPSKTYRNLYYKRKEDRLYRRVSGEDEMDLLVRDYFQRGGIPYKSEKVKSARDTLWMDVQYNVDNISNRIIQVGNHIYWDEEDCRLLVRSGDFSRIIDGDGPDGTAICMRKLFDHTPNDRIKVDINDVMFFQEHIDEVVKYLNENNGVISPDLDECLAPFWTWANEDIDTFNDLLKATASIFFSKKVKGSYFLIGETRNGKSSYIRLLHTMLGSKNTSKLELAAISDRHRNLELLTTMLNAPDEELEGMEQEMKHGQSLFKSMSSHDPITVGVMYSSDSQEVATDFMGFYPMNKMPEWSGDGVQALVQRTLPIFFRKDLSNFDNGGKDFEKETYTAKYFSYLMPILLGMCKYYKDNTLTFSSTMRTNQDTVRTILDAPSVYINILKKYFDSVGNLDFVINDFAKWMRENGYDYDKEVLKTAKQKFQRLSQKQTRYASGLDGAESRVRARFFIDDKKNRPEHRIKIFQNDAILAALDDRTPIEYLSYLNEKGLPDRSIISVFEEMIQAEGKDRKDPIALQEERERHNFANYKVSDGHISDQGELVLDD